MINWFNIPDEGLDNGGLFEVKELEVTENGTYETKGEMYNKVTVNVAGGGGSSDFSTATVTFINSTTGSGDYSVRLAEIVQGASNGIKCRTYYVSKDESVTVVMPIYKDGYAITSGDFSNISTSVMPTTTGDIIFGDGFLVQGNGTITMSSN